VYFYKRLNPLCVPPLGALKVRIPKRVGFEEEDEEVVCDTAFESAIKLAVGPVKGKVAYHLAHCCIQVTHLISNYRFLNSATLHICAVDLHAHALRTIESYLNSSRPTRERKSRVYYE
jgi:hypothetical protein